MPCTGGGTDVQSGCAEQCQHTLAVARLLSALLRGQFFSIWIYYYIYYLKIDTLIYNKKYYKYNSHRIISKKYKW